MGYEPDSNYPVWESLRDDEVAGGEIIVTIIAMVVAIPCLQLACIGVIFLAEAMGVW